MCAALEVEWSLLPPALLPQDLALRLEADKYSQVRFNQKR